MREYGFAIVTNVISSEECSELTVCQRRCAATSFALDTVFHQASFARDLAAVASTDSPDFATMPGHFQKSFCTHLGLMHGEMSWRCRLHPNVRLVYAALYQSDELVTGVDNEFFTQVLPTNRFGGFVMVWRQQTVLDAAHFVNCCAGCGTKWI